MRKITLYIINRIALIAAIVVIAPLKPEADSTSSSLLVGRKLFDIQTEDNLQGVTYWDGLYYVGFDVGKGLGKIRVYNVKGKLIKETDPLAIGHTAELDFRNKNGRLYIANGGGKNPTKVLEIDMTVKNPSITKTLDLSQLGHAGLLAVDNENDTLVIHTADNDHVAPKISFVDFNGQLLKQFTIPYQGIPQGIEVHNEMIYFQTNSLISIINKNNGQVIDQIAVNEPGENEGIAIYSEGKKTYYIYSYRFNNRLYKAELHCVHTLADCKD